MSVSRDNANNEDEVVSAAVADTDQNENEERETAINLNTKGMKGEQEGKESDLNYSARKDEDSQKLRKVDRGGLGDVFFGLQGFLKAYSGRLKYKGGCDEDLLDTTEVYELFAAISSSNVR